MFGCGSEPPAPPSRTFAGPLPDPSRTLLGPFLQVIDAGDGGPPLLFGRLAQPVIAGDLEWVIEEEEREGEEEGGAHARRAAPPASASADSQALRAWLPRHVVGTS